MSISPVLVVDDDPSYSELLVAGLKHYHAEVVWAGSGEEALAMVERHMPSIVLLDVHMPNMDGVEVVRRLRERHPSYELPIMMVTYDGTSAVAKEALDAGADDYVVKPFELDVLTARVRARLRVSQGTAERVVAHSGAMPARSAASEFMSAVTLADVHVGDSGFDQDGDPNLPMYAFGWPHSVINRVVARRYHIESVLGIGGFGAVFRCRHLALETTMAIKILKQSLAQGSPSLEQFRKEGVATCRVRHHNAVAIYDFGVEVDGMAWLTMEMLVGETLAERLQRQGNLTLAEVVNFVRPVCQVLQVAERAGVVHRDLKPANIFYHREDGFAGSSGEVETVKVMDFGIARVGDLAAGRDDHMLGQLVGTPAYMAPELAEGDQGTSATDVYALAVSAFFALTGQHPFVRHGQTMGDITMLLAHLDGALVPLEDAGADIPQEVLDVILWGMARRPQDRPNPAEFAQHLGDAVRKVSLLDG